MGIETLFNASVKCKNFKVYINDIPISDDDIGVIEFAENFFDFGFKGLLTLKDTYSLLNSKKIKFDGSTKITLIVDDYLRNHKKFVFTVEDMKIDASAKRVNILCLTFTDPFTYSIKNTFLSKSFNTHPVDAFKEIINEYGLEKHLDENGIRTEITASGNKKRFVISSDRNVLENFLREFRLTNNRIFINSDKLFIGQFKVKQAEGPLIRASGKQIIYTNTGTNNNYCFKIHDYRKKSVTKSTVFELPVQEVIRFENKKIIKDTVNLSDFYNDLLLNNNDIYKEMQDSTGKKYSVAVDNIEAQQYDLFNTFIKNEEIEIVVPGNLQFSRIGIKTEITLADRSMYTNTLYNGDRNSSGIYLITQVQSKFIKNSFIQKLTLSRFDCPKY